MERSESLIFYIIIIWNNRRTIAIMTLNNTRGTKCESTICIIEGQGVEKGETQQRMEQLFTPVPDLVDYNSHLGKHRKSPTSRRSMMRSRVYSTPVLHYAIQPTNIQGFETRRLVGFLVDWTGPGPYQMELMGALVHSDYCVLSEIHDNHEWQWSMLVPYNKL